MISQVHEHDSAWLAATVRSLAVEVHRLASVGSAESREIAALAGRVRQVRTELDGGNGAMTPLQRWLDGLQQELDSIPVREPAWT